MTISYSPPYLSQVVVNFSKFKARTHGYNNLTNQQVPIVGEQPQMLFINTTLWLGDIELGSQPWTFAATKTAPSESDGHKGLPPMAEVLTPEIQALVLGKMDEYVDSKIPQYNDTSDNAQKGGIALYPKIVRLEINLPYKKTKEHFVRIVIALFKDKDYKYQLLDTDFALTFASDDFITQAAGTVDAEAQAAFKLKNNMYPLADFFASDEIKQAVGGVGQGFFTAGKQYINQYSDIDVPTIMQKFAATFAEVVG